MDNDFVTTDRLIQALRNGEFEPYLQPIVSASNLTVSGAELLVRWHMPTGEIIPPAYFIHRAEAAGLLSLLTEKILNRILAELSVIKTRLPDDFRLAVNVTPSILADSEFTQLCLRLAAHYNIQLILELTEQQPFYMNKSTEYMLNRLSEAGVKFALDDFGTGFSVLSYLKHYPISYIKMDKSFTQDVAFQKTSISIVESVVELAIKLGVNTVAEGVETHEQVSRLRSIGVGFLQGFYFGRPEKVDAFCLEYSL
ncbi:EAL domain-containing protein [Escherichia coli]|nr:EAL domain-containing protein [Escherichia coli]EIT3941702.1 EAL domain-containing protein [Escherichia coli]